ncbi:hypothetical protein PIB30_017042 [Stylosanthes scabra]|uniref:Retrotransposon gag domain-containing protein n=1 Tax=Stylosanthes scabra TaxID=79078 RepID=A0ABU6R7T9_9FABA|nr:hypothetical protein [Stylosanthes scabra]
MGEKDRRSRTQTSLAASQNGSVNKRFVTSGVSNFQELANKFISNFVASAIYMHDSYYLTTIKQGQHESLKDYLTRFNKVVMDIPNLHPEVHLHALKRKLRPGQFQETIVVAKPKILAEFREKGAGKRREIEVLKQARLNDNFENQETA